MTKFILKDDKNRVYAPYGGRDFSDVMYNAEEFDRKTALKKARELSKKHHIYIQIIEIVSYE